MKLEDVNQKTTDALETLVATLGSGHSEVLMHYLRAIAKFHAYSFGNIGKIFRDNHLWLVGAS
jgi:hypothetical protein